MEKEFKKNYEELTKKYGEKYKPLLSDKYRKFTLYVFFSWLIISFITMFFKRFGFIETDLYIIIDLIEKIIVLFLFILVIYMSKKNFEYWSKAFEFKKEVGIDFWKKIDEKNEYKVNRKDINYEKVKEELDNMLLDNIKIIDIEDELILDNKKMYTVRYDNKDKVRFNGVFVVIENFKIETENIVEYIKSLNLNISGILKNAIQKDNKIYILLDAVEIFKFSNKDFLKEKELYDNFVRYNDIKTLCL